MMQFTGPNGTKTWGSIKKTAVMDNYLETSSFVSTIRIKLGKFVLQVKHLKQTDSLDYALLKICIGKQREIGDKTFD